MAITNIVTCTTGCTPTVNLPAQTTDPACSCSLWNEGINEIYFIPCDEVDAATIDVDILDIAWWTALKAANKVYKFGIGVGAIAVKNAITKPVPDGCGGTKDVRTNTEWQLTYEKSCIDKTVAMSTHAEMNALIGGALKKFNLVVRYCEAEFVAFIGAVSLASYDAPHNGEGLKFSYEFTWKNPEVVVPINVQGLNTVLPLAVASY
jgi:hypothetical protein